MKKALVVDNHPVLLKFMVRLLEKHGMSVLTAEDGLSALEVLKTETPDLIFTDMIMPNIDGEKLCRIVRGMPALDNTFLVILSSIAADEDLDFNRLGANACIAKGPFDQMAGHVIRVVECWAAGDLEGLSHGVLGAEDRSDGDITRELLTTKRHIEIILENISEGVLELTLEGTIVYANGFARYLTGYPAEDLLGRDFEFLFTETDRPVIRNLLSRQGTLPRSISKDSPLIVNGKQVSINVLPAEEKGKRSYIVILNDVSELMRVKRQLRSLRQSDEN